MSTSVTVDGRKAVVYSARYYPGVKTADYCLYMGAGSGPRTRPFLEVTLDRQAAEAFCAPLLNGRTYRVELADGDGWLGHHVECRSFTYRGLSQPNAYTGRAVASFVGEAPPPLS